MSKSHDIIIMGGGPAGLACGNFLAQSGFDTLVLEAEQHPKHHIGESLLAASMPILQNLGISMPEMTQHFQPKFGARFYDPPTDHLETFEFEPIPNSPSPSYQVLRAPFDALLLEKARAAGCQVRENSPIASFEENLPNPTVTLKDGQQLSCRFLVDATGRQPLLAIKRKTRTVISDYGRVGIYNYFTNLPPHDSHDPNFITMYLFPAGWFWLIPLAGNITSVGAVFRDVPSLPTSNQPKPEALFWHAVSTMPRLEKRLRAATITQPFRAINDYSFTVSEKIGPNFAAIGDAAGFLDPIFSSGVHLGLSSAQRASAAIVKKLSINSDTALHEYAAYMDQGFHVFRAFVHRFYNRDLIRNVFFMENKPPEIYRAITRILAGHVWETDNPVLKLIGLAP